MQKILTLAFLLVSIHCTGQNIMIFHGDSVAVNDTAIIKMDIENTDPFAAFQFDLLVPDGLEFVEGSAELSDRKTDHSLIASSIAEDTIRFIAFSPMNSNFSGNEGQVLQLQLLAGNNPGIFPIDIFNCIIGGAHGNNILTEVINDSVFVDDPLGLNYMIADHQFSVYPNPSNGRVTLKLPNEQPGFFTFRVLALNGQQIFSKDIYTNSSALHFNLSSYLLPGHYFILMENQKQIYMQQIIIN